MFRIKLFLLSLKHFSNFPCFPGAPDIRIWQQVVTYFITRSSDNFLKTYVPNLVIIKSSIRKRFSIPRECVCVFFNLSSLNSLVTNSSESLSSPKLYAFHGSEPTKRKYRIEKLIIIKGSTIVLIN